MIGFRRDQCHAAIEAPFSSSALVCRLRLRRRFFSCGIAAECHDGGHEVASVDVSRQGNYVASDVTFATVPDLLPGVYAEAIPAAAHWAWTNKLGPLPLKLNTATLDLVFDWHAVCAFRRRQKG